MKQVNVLFHSSKQKKTINLIIVSQLIKYTCVLYVCNHYIAVVRVLRLPVRRNPTQVLFVFALKLSTSTDFLKFITRDIKTVAPKSIPFCRYTLCTMYRLNIS